MSTARISIASKQLAEIKEAATKAGLTNVTVVEGAAGIDEPAACVLRCGSHGNRRLTIEPDDSDGRLRLPTPTAD